MTFTVVWHTATAHTHTHTDCNNDNNIFSEM